MANQLRKRAAALVLPVLVHPRAPPAPVLGQGPGKRVQVQGNARQNVSISSIFLMIYWTTSVICPVMLFLFFSLFSSPHLWCWETPCADWLILLDDILSFWNTGDMKEMHYELVAQRVFCTWHGRKLAGVLVIVAFLVEVILPLWTEPYLNPPVLLPPCQVKMSAVYEDDNSKVV